MKNSMLWCSMVMMLCVFTVGIPTRSSHAATNTLKIQHGMHYFFEHCSGCHTLRYLPVAWPHQDAMVDIQAVRRGSLTKEQALHWFGTQPPDLSLIVSQRGAVWIKNYLTGFYYDSTRPFFANNTWLPNTAMPNVLYPYAIEPEALDELLLFLTEVAEPQQAMHYRIGLIVVACVVLLWWMLRYLSKVC